jgi:hypothetical protein
MKNARRKFFVITVFVGIVLWGCGNHKKQLEVAKQIQENIHATSCLITKGTFDDSIKVRKKRIELSFTGVDKKNLDDRIVSTAALYFYQNDTSDISKFDEISVSITDGSSSFRKSYTIDDIKAAEALWEFPGSTFFKWYDTDSIHNILDFRFPDPSLHKIDSMMLSIDSSYGKIKNVGFAGWTFSFIKETHEPLQVFYATAINGSYMTDYLICVLPSSKKIANISILDSPHH